MPRNNFAGHIPGGTFTFGETLFGHSAAGTSYRYFNIVAQLQNVGKIERGAHGCSR